MHIRNVLKLKPVVLIATFALTTGVVLMQYVFAATGSLYISPASTSVKKGANFSVNVRINPGTSTDTVTATVGFDSTKLKYVSTDYSGSPYNTQVGASSSANSVSFTSTNLSGAAIGSDSHVAKVTFTALGGSGSASISLSGNAAYAGNPTGPSTSGATIALTTPVTPTPTCPSGYTGTYPNCVKPTTPTTPTTPPKPTTTTPTPTKTTTSTPTPATSTTTTKNVTASGRPASVADKKVEFTNATLTFTTNVPTKAYIRYGIDEQLNVTTPVSEYATSHSVAIDPATLIPGTSYSYVIVSTDKNGAVSQTGVEKFSTKGLVIKVAVLDEKRKPLRNKEVTLHSTPQTAKSDDDGIVTFTDVAPGNHKLVYSVGKQAQTKELTVANTVQNGNEGQVATVQNFSVVYQVKQNPINGLSLFWLFMALIVFGGVAVLVKSGRLQTLSKYRSNKNGMLAPQPTVVSSAQTPINNGYANPSQAAAEAQKQESINRTLEAIAAPNKPNPGSTIAPIHNSESDQN